MDVHRSRFVSYPTVPITAVAFSRSSDSDSNSETPQPALKLAVARQNGDVELWDPQGGKWLQETVFGGDGRSIDGLAWTREPDELDLDGNVILGQYRLFSISASPSVTEWDLQLGHTRNVSTGNFSEVWCFAAQPRSQTKPRSDQDDLPAQELVAGCEDGTLVLLSTNDGDLQFKRFLARVSGKKARCMSITYQNRERVVAGFVDSTIRVYDTRNGSQIRAMSLGTSIPGAPKNTIVWQVRCLSNGDIVSGDSTGDVKIWDGRSYSLAQRIAGHDSDCLDIVASSDCKTLFTGALDGRIAQYKKTPNPNGRETWAKTYHKRTHQGEVKCMTAFDSDEMSIVVSGGSDVNAVVAPLREFGKEHNRVLPNLPQAPPLASAPHARLLVSWWDKSISIWRLARQTTPALDASSTPRRLVAKITLNTKHHIRSVAITPNGKCLAASTSSEVKLFQLGRRTGQDKLCVRKLTIPEDITSSGARLVAFSPNGKWLAMVTPDNEVHVVRLAQDASNARSLCVLNHVVELDRTFGNDIKQRGFNRYAQTITCLAFSDDSAALATSDLSGHLDTWLLEGHEDASATAIATLTPPSRVKASEDDSDSDSSDDDDDNALLYGQRWVENPNTHLLPNLESMPLVLTFRPSRTMAGDENGVTTGVRSRSQYFLWIMTAQHQIHEFDIVAGRLSTWSRQNPSSALPEDFVKLRDRVMGAVWDSTTQRERIWLYGNTWLFMLNVDNNDAGLHARATKVTKKRSAAQITDLAALTDPTSMNKKLRTGLSGAGEKFPLGKRHDGLSAPLARRYEGGVWSPLALEHKTKSHNVDQDSDGEDHEESSDDEEVDNIASEANTAEPSSHPNHSDGLVPSVNPRPQSQAPQRSRNPSTKKSSPGFSGRRWWCSFRYRPILGIVPLISLDADAGTEIGAEKQDDDDLFSSTYSTDMLGNGNRPLEIVVVERPRDDATRMR